MTQPPPQPGSSHSQEPSSATRREQKLAAAVAELVGSRVPAPAFYKALLALLVERLDGVAGALELDLRGNGIRHDLHGKRAGARSWTGLLQTCLTDALLEDRPRARLFRPKDERDSLGLISTHLPTPQSPRGGALVLVVPCKTQHEADVLLAQIDSLVYLTLLFLKSAEAPAPSAPGKSGAQAASFRKLSTTTSPMELALAITNNLRTKSESDQVAYGRVRGKRVEVYAVSGLDRVKQRNPGIQQIQAAMGESLDYGGPIVLQTGEVDSEIGGEGGWRLHRAWQESTGDSCVATIPLGEEGDWSGVIALRRGGKHPFVADEIGKYREMVTPYAQGLGLVERAHRGLLSHVTARCLELMGGFLRLEHWRSTTFTLLATAVGLWASFGTLPHRVSTRCVVVPREVRHMAVPFDGILRAAHLIPGERFREGDLLASLDTTDLELEAGHLRSELEIARLEERRALGEGLATDAFIARTHRESWASQLALVERKIAQAELRAPFDGMVVEGDLRARIGDRVTKGEDLYHLTATADWRLELWIPEREVGLVEPGLGGTFVTHARPGEKRDVSILRILPSAQPKEGQTVYVAEARWEFEADWVRPGMEGYARIRVGDRPVWRAALDRVVHWMQMNYWL